MRNNLILKTDSYKFSQWLQYPPNTATMSSYIEARGGAPESVFFGLQAFIKEYLLEPVTLRDINEAEKITAAHGVPFYREGWELLLKRHGGLLPLEIQAAPEGLVMPTNNVQVQVKNTDPDFFWLTSYIETIMLRGVWYPSTVATNSRKAKKLIGNYLMRSSDDGVAGLPFKLHDFGARGASSGETAMLGGMAHLVNFMGTDTVEGLIGANLYYGEDMAGFSIPASEHSTMTSWGKENEEKAYRNMLEVFGGDGKLLACVSDSYDIYKACRDIWGGSLKDEVMNSGGTLVVRPDSGNPEEVPIKVIEILMDKFGFEMNAKGYKVLPDYIRVIQGDGITTESLPAILANMEMHGLSGDNLAFGMGGGLLQQVNRDNLRYAMKASAREDTNGVWHDVNKSPISGGKTSKKGRLALELQGGIGSQTYRTIPEGVSKNNLLETVYLDGELVKETTFAEVRARAEVQFNTEEFKTRYE